MFEAKQKQLIERAASAPASEGKQPFVQASMKKAAMTTSLGNGAVKFVTTGNDFVDQFGKLSNYKAPREYKLIDADMRLLWSQNPLYALCLTFYIRMVTRIVSFFDGTKTASVQRGQGLKHEGIMRMIWIAVNYPDSFYKNLALFISIGSWKDVITMLSYDLQYNGWDGRKLNWDNMGHVILAGLENPKTSNLVKKYLPSIRSTSKCKTLESQADNLIAKWICSLLYGSKKNPSYTYKQYRVLKSSGNAHQWQQLISQGKHIEINFDTVHGRALAQLVSSKYLKNRGLEKKYEEWIASKPIAKFTGYVYELFEPLGTTAHSLGSLKPYQIETMNKQFLGLIETAKKDMNDASSLIVVLDTSGSMQSNTPGTKSSAYTIGKSLALFFSYLLKGPFENHWLEFSNETVMKQWKGKTPVEKLVNDHSGVIASTNFQSVADHFVKIRQAGIAESDFPSGILCISDGCFNASAGKTQTKELKARLKRGGFSQEYIDNFKIILWDIPNSYYGKSQTAFEEFADCPNLFYMAGFDGSAVAFLTGTKGKPAGTPSTAEELFKAAMDQEVLNKLEV